ncbi:hypothetical protein GGH94_004782 [Coemansia aciculifera]|uniref:Pentatricopeptide repeat-containing protein-mitochondrial domain-containing protein n=1 Tax=Coemansia aciculifera TaxID=417176 RepID=A0A9W8IL88_9FUNG|nr:hypothetical protein GGH94_004782 [Coemansia aciculifera]
MFRGWRRLSSVGPRRWLRQYTDVAKQVRQIVHPSEYSQIEQTKDIAQQARVQGEDIGERLRADSRQQHQRALLQLDALFKSVAASAAPSAADFSAVLEGYQTLESAGQCVHVLQAMRAAGHRATAAQLGTALSLASKSHSAAAIAGIGEEMRACGVALDDGCYASHMIASLAVRWRTEHAYAVYVDARRHGNRVISRAAYSQLVVALADAGECDLALEVVRDAGAAAVALDEPTYRALLRGAGRTMHYAAYTAAYSHLTAVVGAQLTETDYCAGLSVAARAKDAALAAAIVRRMRGAGYPLSEYHMEPVFDALVGGRRWAAAFRALAAMRDAGFATTPASLRSLTRALTVDHQQAERLADAAHAELLSAARTAPRALDTATLNAMLAGLSLSGCVEAAADRLRRWYAVLPRDVDSHAAVLRGCVARKNMTVAEQCLALCIDSDRLVPTKSVYELMIDVALRQFNYEDAFVYLDAMKVHGFAPGWRTYSSIVRRCAAVRDPRASIALAEMRSAGLAVTPALADFVKTAGRSARHTPAPTPEHNPDGGGEDGLGVRFKL